MAHEQLVRTDRGLGSRFGKEHVRQFARVDCDYCGRRGAGESCNGCGAPLPLSAAEKPVIMYDPQVMADAQMLGQPRTNIPVAFGYEGRLSDAIYAGAEIGASLFGR